jgi:purine-binding chemotaxis protein CheW
MEYEEITLAEQEDTLVGSQERKYLTFTLGKEEFGINIEDVREIIGIQKITEVPDMPIYIKGIINLRGKIIPVMCVRLKFSMLEKDYNDRTSIIVVDVEGQDVGLIVDTVSEVLDIPVKNIDTQVENKGNAEYVEGFGKIENSVKILLDIKKLLSGLSI